MKPRGPAALKELALVSVQLAMVAGMAGLMIWLSYQGG